MFGAVGIEGVGCKVAGDGVCGCEAGRYGVL